MTSEIKKTRFAFLLIVAAIMIFLVGGVNLLRDNFYLQKEFFEMQADFLRVKAADVLDYGRTGSFSISQKTAKSVPVLLYHGVIRDPNFKSDGVNISQEEFERQMFALRDAGYMTISLEDFLAFMRREKKLPEKSFLITFDDGRKDSFYNVDPILRALDWKAAMFVISGRSLGAENEKNPFHLNEVELQKMIASGRWEIGSHTKNGHEAVILNEDETQKGHFMADRIWLSSGKRLENDAEFFARIEKDLGESKRELSAELGINVSTFAFPFGDYGHNSLNFAGHENEIKQIVDRNFEISFRQAGDSEYPSNYPGWGFTYAKRINAGEAADPSKLVDLLNSSLEKEIPYDDNFNRNLGWMGAWGDSRVTHNTLESGAIVVENSSLTFLNGTFGWEDYAANAKISIAKGNMFAILARYQDANNQVSCDFSNSQVVILERSKGIEKDIAETQKPLALSAMRDFEAGIAVQGNEVQCLLDGKVVLSGKISENLARGGIGFKTWDTLPGSSKILVRELAVFEK